MLTSRECAQIIAQAWLDEEFKSLLEKDPSAALKQYGIEIDGVLPIQARPEDLKDEELEVISENRKRQFPSTRNELCPMIAGNTHRPPGVNQQVTSGVFFTPGAIGHLMRNLHHEMKK